MPSPDIEYVVVGYSGGMLGELDKLVPAGSVCVVEEPDLIEVGDLRAKAEKHGCVGELVDGPAQRQDGSPPPHLAALSTARAVIAGGEYVVVAVAAYAQAANLPGSGLPAALILRDKARLRQAADDAGLAQPRWAAATGVDDLRAFRDRHGGRCVLKPTNRWASIGVQVLGPDDDLVGAWAARAGADESTLLSRSWQPDRYLVEQYLPGPEISAEVLVSDGDVLFVNVTGKSVFPGRHPVEAGHVVPAMLDAAVRERVVEANRRLAAAVGFRTGALHSEWILVDGVEPHLVECAGRLPGDAIVPLIDLAYDCSLLEILLRILSGERPEMPGEAKRATAIRFIQAPPGTVRAVHGFEQASAVESVFYAGPTVKPGDVVAPLACSWDRVGHVVTVADDGPDAIRRAEQAAALVTYDID